MERRAFKHLTRPRPWSSPQLARSTAAYRYVAFVDILGFGHKVEADLNHAIALYDHFFERVAWANPRAMGDLRLVVISDSIVAQSDHLLPVVWACNVLQFFALNLDTMIRGGIAHGLHLEAARGGNWYVVSQPLTSAVRIERTIGHPCVALHPDLPIPPEAYRRPRMSNFERLLLFYDGNWIVSPFNLLWGQSAMTRVAQLAHQFPEHSAKYDWFLGLYEAAAAGAMLLPPGETFS